MPEGSVCFVDTETTGLDAERHQIWEVALITPDGSEHLWQFPVEDELAADPFSLNISRYWDRRWDHDLPEISVTSAIYDAHMPHLSRRKNFPDQGRAVRPGRAWAQHFRFLTAGHHLAGAVVSFDEERLRRLLRKFGVLPRWHYHLIDVEALAAGFLAARGETPALPWNSDELMAALGVSVPGDERHTALGDARWARRIYETVMGSPPAPFAGSGPAA